MLFNRGIELDDAEVYLQRAVEADPVEPYGLATYARFLEKVRKDMANAEAFYIRAINAAPEHEYVIKRYADFLRNVRGDYAKAEDLEGRLAKPPEKSL